MKNVQISQELFLELIKYFCLDDTSETRYNNIKNNLETKLDKLARHETYTAYKTSENPDTAEQARQRYLDLVGIHKDFRY